jgi:dihydrofolate synthase/folylpolyglutamate synthase
VDVEERIRISGELISRQAFCRLLTILRNRVDELISKKKLLNPPTYFEHLCCLSFLHFAEKSVDLAIMEVGMGGRFDATNVVVPEASVITTISAEHQKFLGESLSQIASEKAGIIKPSVPVVCGARNIEAFTTIKKRAEELNAPFFPVFDLNNDFAQRKTRKGHVFDFRISEEVYTYSPSLPGEHQARNAAVAIVTSRVLDRLWKKLEKEKIISGIETTRWEGRLESIPGRPHVLLDGAHNEEGAVILRDYVKKYVSAPVVLLFAAMRDKKLQRMGDILFPLAEKVLLTRFPYFRACPPEEIKEQTPAFENKIICEPDVGKAFRKAQKLAGPEGVVLVAGSLFLIGEIKKITRGSAFV